jgi:hypothetical protein
VDLLVLGKPRPEGFAIKDKNAQRLQNGTTSV